MSFQERVLPRIGPDACPSRRQTKRAQMQTVVTTSPWAVNHQCASAYMPTHVGNNRPLPRHSNAPSNYFCDFANPTGTLRGPTPASKTSPPTWTYVVARFPHVKIATGNQKNRALSGKQSPKKTSFFREEYMYIGTHMPLTLARAYAPALPAPPESPPASPSEPLALAFPLAFAFALLFAAAFA